MTLLSITLLFAAYPVSATADDLDLDPEFADDPIPEIWADADGEEARQQSERSWIWGPAIKSATHEPYIDSPDGFRAVYYFDKARMEINNPDEPWDSIWYATSGRLIPEMMLGEIQIGDSEAIDTAPAEIPVTGDLEENEGSPTYATLGARSSLDDQTENLASDRTGEESRTMLHADGSVDEIDPPAGVRNAYYDDTLGHNVPDVFWDWMADQPIDWEYLIGYPVTEAYWVETRIGGQERIVLVQAFERRVLTFNPVNDPEWQVEAGNAGLHYREWRGLNMPENPALHALAYSVPYGEIITGAAVANGVDPFLLAGVASKASGFDPLAELNSDRVGLMGMPSPLLEQRGVEYPFDPTYNAHIAADLLAMIENQNGSWEAAVEEYFSWQDEVGTFADLPESAGQDAIGAWREIYETYHGLSSPFGIEEGYDASAFAPPSEELVEPGPAEPPEVDEDGLYLVGSGEAAHYGQEAFPVERMEEIMEIHAAWEGGAIPDWDYDPNGYYCVHPEFMVGERLHLTAPNGETFWCTIADYVAYEHRDYWYSKWAIEVNWDLFEAMGVPYQETIEVRAPAD